MGGGECKRTRRGNEVQERAIGRAGPRTGVECNCSLLTLADCPLGVSTQVQYSPSPEETDEAVTRRCAVRQADRRKASRAVPPTAQTSKIRDPNTQANLSSCNRQRLLCRAGVRGRQLGKPGPHASAQTSALWHLLWCTWAVTCTSEA